MSNHIGAPKDKLQFAATLVAVIPLPPHVEWGQRFLYSFTDAEANQFVWRTKTKPEFMGIAPGAAMTVRGTVKRHGEFRGVKQTELERCVLEAA